MLLQKLILETIDFKKNIFKEFKFWPLHSSATQKWIELILWIIKAIGGIFSNLFIKVGSCNVEEKFSFGAHRVDWNNNFQSKESIPQARLMGVPGICWERERERECVCVFVCVCVC